MAETVEFTIPDESRQAVDTRLDEIRRSVRRARGVLKDGDRDPRVRLELRLIKLHLQGIQAHLGEEL